jgi:hypothetical protein
MEDKYVALMTFIGRAGKAFSTSDKKNYTTPLLCIYLVIGGVFRYSSLFSTLYPDDFAAFELLNSGALAEVCLSDYSDFC